VSVRRKLNKILQKHGMVIERSTPEVLASGACLKASFDLMLRWQIALDGGELRFVQIGGNDGVSRDDDLMPYVRRYTARGLVLEPQPDIFKLLETNYAEHKGVCCLNQAIHRDAKSMTLYRLDTELLARRTDLPNWARTNGIASFNRDHVSRAATKLKLDPSAIVEITVECRNVNELLDSLDWKPSLIKIDVEGYDVEILRDLDLERHCPALLRFEHHNTESRVYSELLSMLASHGYQFMTDDMDTIACRPPA
jgi:FkbM family methyltransferase